VAYKEIMDELHAIREGIYEETKDLSPAELAAWTIEHTKDLVAQLGLPVATSPAKTKRAP
jgi:hypothetical protein